MNAAEVPKPINVHIFGRLLTTQAKARWMNGQPAQNTMGNVSTSSIQLCVAIANRCNRWPSIASTATATVNGNVHKNLRAKSRSSGSQLHPASAFQSQAPAMAANG